MSYHVYIALKGFKDNPISQQNWLEAVQHCGKLQTEWLRNRLDKVFYRVHLKSDRNSVLSLDRYGLGHAQDPSKEMIESMFEVAEELCAHVYSEKLRCYTSVQDWEEHTRSYRACRDKRLNQRNMNRSRVRFFIISIVLIFVVLGWYIN